MPTTAPGRIRSAVFVGAQNDLFEMFHMTLAANDVAYFDGGFGGATFIGCQISNAGRYHLRFDGLVASPNTYGCPADIQFNQCRFEGSGGVSVVKLNAGYNITFDGTDLYTTKRDPRPDVRSRQRHPDHVPQWRPAAGRVVGVVAGDRGVQGRRERKLDPGGPPLLQQPRLVAWW